jgi:F420-non-reducing hydrogenase iron-sulfur subunit
VEIMQDSTRIAVFVCANCARPGKEFTSSGRARPVIPDFDLPGQVHQVIIPCAGRLQPEHVLKAFESGSQVVSVIACDEENCHFAEGSRRCSIRVEYIRSLLNEIGLGEGRLLLSYLPGSAVEDLDIASGKPINVDQANSLIAPVEAIRAQVIEALRTCPPNPLLELYPDVSDADFVIGEMVSSEGESDE